MPDKWIQGATSKHPGAFSAKAEKAGMSVKEFASHVIGNPRYYDETTAKEARLARTLAGFRRKSMRKGRGTQE
jgi:hypothetical protein